MGPLVQDPNHEKPEKMKEVIAEDMNLDATKVASSSFFDLKQSGGASNFSVGEGRVHGGSHFVKVSSVLGARSRAGVVISDSSKPMKPYMLPRNWM